MFDFDTISTTNSSGVKVLDNGTTVEGNKLELAEFVCTTNSLTPIINIGSQIRPNGNYMYMGSKLTTTSFGVGNNNHTYVAAFKRTS